MNARKRIAVLIAQPNAAYQKYLLQGILQEAFTYDIDVLVFSSFVKSGDDILCTSGEKKIYDFIPYEKVDAVIVIPDTIQITGVLTRILAKLKSNFNGPVLLVDTESSEFPFIHNDDAMDIKCMIDHLIDVHGYRSIAFMTGPKEHLHSQWRLKGYLDSLQEHGIPTDEDLIFYGDFWYREGKGVVEKVLSMNPRPQAIACGSQVMAISVYDALRKHGVKIPEEMAVVGYDPNGAEVESNYPITTTVRSSRELGIRAARTIIERLTGRKIETEKQKTKISFNHSCGCPCQTQEKEMFWTNQYVGNDINELSDSFYSIYNYMLEDIIEPKELIQCYYRVMYYTKYIKGFSTFHICLNQDWVERGQSALDYTENMLCVVGLQENRAKEPIIALDYKFPREQMLPILDEVREKPSVFYFTPLHFCGVDFGYSVISYEDECKVYPKCYSEWIRKLENGLESQRRQCSLQRMYELMRGNAVKDLLTSVYSRNGFNLYGSELFEEAKSSGRKLLVIVGDVNDTKYVNDTFGHMEGDTAIKIIAEAFQSQLDQEVEHGKVFRIGGDEFILMAIGEYTEKQIASKLCGIRKATDIIIQNKQKPYELSTSLGTYYGIIELQDELNKIIALADAKMYYCKNIHRKVMRSKLTKIQQNYANDEV